MTFWLKRPPRHATTEHERGERPRKETKNGGGGRSAEVEKNPHARYYSLTRPRHSVCGDPEETHPPETPNTVGD